MTIDDIMALADGLVAEAHQTASAESGSRYYDITGPANEDKARSNLRTAIEAALQEAVKGERERAAQIADEFDENQDYGAGDEIRKGPTP